MSQLLSIIQNVLKVFDLLVYIVIALAVVFFLVGLIKYLIAPDPSSASDARGMIVNGIIILFVMISVWGLVNILSDTFGIRSTNAPAFFPVPTSGLVR